MDGQVYTHAMWRVRPGEEEAFVHAWDELADAFGALAKRPRGGTLIRSATDPTLFYSFGPWESLSDAAAMRADPAAQRAIERVRACCLEATPGIYEVVRHIDLSGARLSAPA